MKRILTAEWRNLAVATFEETFEFEIKHLPWNIFPSTSFELEIDAEALYGKELASFFYQKPLCCFLMDGSYTEISRPVLL